LDVTDVFVPSKTYMRDGQRITIHLMEGYAFVATGLSESEYFALERNSQYVRKVISSMGPNGIPVLQVLSNTNILEMLKRLAVVMSEDIEEGMQVKVNQGKYAGLDGEVLFVENGSAYLHIKLRSFEVIRAVPVAFLDPVGEENVP